MEKITLQPISEQDAAFLNTLMNLPPILEALNEIPTQLRDWQEAIQEWERDPDEEDYLVRIGETPVGWLGVNGLASEDGTAYLKMAAILPEYQGRGIGVQAVREVVEILRRRRVSRVLLYTDQENRKAVACYTKCGFTVRDRLTEEMSNGKLVDRYEMEVTLI